MDRNNSENEHFLRSEHLTSKVDYIKALQKMFTFLLDPKIDDKIAEFSGKLNAFIYLLWYKVNVWFLSG